MNALEEIGYHYSLRMRDTLLYIYHMKGSSTRYLHNISLFFLRDFLASFCIIRLSLSFPFFTE